MNLPHVLSRAGEVDIDLDAYRADELKKAARFWVGKEAATFPKGKCITALAKAFRGKAAAKKALLALSPKQMKTLSLFARYGPVVSGSLLKLELDQRGLASKPDDSVRSFHRHRHRDEIDDLSDKLVLLVSGDGYYRTSYYDRDYPKLALHPLFAESIEPAKPIAWKASGPSPPVKTYFQRSSAEVALDIWLVANSLEQMGGWKTVKGDSLAKSSRNKLRKLAPLPCADDDPLAPPDPQSLYYELLLGMGLLSVHGDSPCVRTITLEDYFAQPAFVQAWAWVRAWLGMYLWQDGIGVVPDRDHHYESIRIEPFSLLKAKELLVWALCRVAHGSDEWLDLEGFLKDFWRTSHEVAASFYWRNYTWDPDFRMARSKEELARGADRSLAFWLDDEGSWAGNVIMVTLVELGLIERGESGGKKRRWSFRLTQLGRTVFGAPESPLPDERQALPFLTVQPNHDVVAYLDAADARQICTLARFAQRGSDGHGKVQTFTLSRPSVYAALESGMTVDQIESFLIEHGKTELPANVSRMLSEWSGRRESLVLRTQVTLAVSPERTKGSGVIDGSSSVMRDSLGKVGRALSDNGLLLPKMTKRKATTDRPKSLVLDHQADLPRPWQVDELGGIRTGDGDSISRARLSAIAEGKGDCWQVNGASIARSRKQGCTADDILRWLDSHSNGPVPPILEMAVRNWTGRPTVFTGRVQLLQVSRPQARDAILSSPTFEPLLDGHIPPDWFVVRNDKIAEVKRLLKQLGFSFSESSSLATLAEVRQRETT